MYDHPCPGGCGKRLGPLSRICGDCASAEARKAAQHEAGISLWAAQGIREFGELLARHAAFQAWLTHRHPPV